MGVLASVLAAVLAAASAGLPSRLSANPILLTGGSVASAPDAPAGLGMPSPPSVAGETAKQAHIRTLITEAWGDATATWPVVIGQRTFESDPPQINFVAAVRASHCYGLYISPGPVYCSGNNTVFVSLSEMERVSSRIAGVGDLGLAFLVAHELGHHVQKVRGRFRALSALVRAAPQLQRELSLRFELEADCLAGIWAGKSPKFATLAGAREAMLTAIDAIGDDKVQLASAGLVNPATFTHGTSAQRVRWFKAGVDGGTIESCDVLNAAIID